MAETVTTDGEVGKPAPSKVSVQLKRLQEANAKYKNLLMMAKERIQQQESELETVKAEKIALEQRRAEDEAAMSARLALGTAESEDRGGADDVHNIVRVCQRLNSEGEQGHEEIWALVEMEIVPQNDMTLDVSSVKRYKEWKRFDTESELQDFIRRDTGEPLTLPPYSLSPEQSSKIQQSAQEQVSAVTEEFRRFRVRAELARKQADAQIRELQSKKFQSAAARIEGQDMQSELDKARSASSQVERLKAELAAQEAQWRDAYDRLLAENNALKSSGSEALLASQWRQRYEGIVKEKEELEQQLQSGGGRSNDPAGDSYEAKYRDLKESFRLYRKKAKEIFEAQERGAVAPSMSTAATFAITEASTAEAKLSYLKNLMVNYLTADQAVRDHMESAIGTVLQFTPDDRDRIQKKKSESETWF